MARFLVYLFNLILAMLMGGVLSRILQHLLGTPKTFFRSSQGVPPPGKATPGPRGETARDPVCGMFVSIELSHRLSQGGQTLHFCSAECLERYQKKPPNA